LRRGQTAQLRIFGYVASVTEGEVQRAVQHGVTDFVQLPFIALGARGESAGRQDPGHTRAQLQKG